MNKPKNKENGCCPSKGLIDTHAHIAFSDYDKDRYDVIQRAWDEGLEFIINIGAGEGLEGNFKAVKLAESDPRIFASVGIHPHDADKADDSWFKSISELASNKKVKAIGETGLDFFKTLSSVENQERCFRKHIRIAKDMDLPLVIHSRDAHKEVLDILKKEGPLTKGGVFHCFSGGANDAEEIIGLGLNISIPGIVTFDNAKELQEVVALIPLEKIVIETDCPYLAPQPFRGKKNEPVFVKYIAEKIAEIKKLSKADVARITGQTAKRLFQLPGSEKITSIAYQIRNSLYLNITNRCTLACHFCPKQHSQDYEVKGYYLKLDKEPNVEELFQAIGEPQGYDEVVFCGYGEPTLRLEVVKIIAERMKEKGAKSVRLNTDGLANLVYGRNIAKELKGLIDSVSISINASDAKSYAKLCPSKFGEKAFLAIKDFVKECKKNIPDITITAVRFPGSDSEKIITLGKELGVKVRVREYMQVG